MIHNSRAEIPFRGGFVYIDSLHEVLGGYVVLADHEGELSADRELFLVKPDGTRTSIDKEGGGGLISEPTVSDDGTQIAWSSITGSYSSSRAKTKLNVYDITAGRVTYTKEVPGGGERLLQVRSFLGSKVLLRRATNAPSKPVKIWDPRRGTLTDWHDSLDVAGSTADGSLAAVIAADPRDGSCFAVLELPSQRQLWRSCEFDQRNVFFAPGNRYVASSNVDIDPVDFRREIEAGKEPPEPRATVSLNIFAARTGEPVLRIKDQADRYVAWESDDTFLFMAFTGKEQNLRGALVRCTTTGACELATEPQSSNVKPPYAFAIRR